MVKVSVGNFVCVVTMMVANVNADVYPHYPRGSNNRLNEKSANRGNANRLFDSQVSFILLAGKESILEGVALVLLSCLWK